MGCASSGKTHEAAWLRLCEYFIWPECTCVLVTSTTLSALRKRIWAEITMLWQEAVDNHPVAGNLLDSALAICTDALEPTDWSTRRVRDMRKGIFGVPCVVGNRFVGLAKFVGIKQQRMRLISDEASMMGSGFLSAFANLSNNDDFEAEILGNPNDPLDPLGRAAEPRSGWTDKYLEPEKTACWDTRFMNGRCVNLVGTDSPNFDFPQDQPIKYKYLISGQKINDTLSFFAKDSVEFYSQCRGVMKVGTVARRIFNRYDCERFGAFTDAIWDGESQLTRVAGLDAAWGGDRAILTAATFGREVSGKIVLRIDIQIQVPVLVRGESAENQLAEYVRAFCEERHIPPEHFAHDATGRGSLGTALARVWSPSCHPIEFGGIPTRRPVSLDLYWTDPRDGQRKLKAACDHYSKFVTELWFSATYAVEAGQLRNLPQEAFEEGALRMWDKVRDGKIELETKIKMKERVGRSPDMMDSLVIAVEVARRVGFNISKLAQPVNKKKEDWLQRQADDYTKMMHDRLVLHHLG
jgi:hypothetical protein